MAGRRRQDRRARPPWWSGRADHQDQVLRLARHGARTMVQPAPAARPLAGQPASGVQLLAEVHSRAQPGRGAARIWLPRREGSARDLRTPDLCQGHQAVSDRPEFRRASAADSLPGRVGLGLCTGPGRALPVAGRVRVVRGVGNTVLGIDIMRIALVSREFPPGSRSGGIGTYTEKTARALSRLGQEVHVFTEGDPNTQGSPARPVRMHFLPEIQARPDEQRVMRRSLAVARALWTSGPFDVVQASEWDAEAVAYALRPRSVLVTRLATPAYVVNRLNGMSRRARVRTAVVGRLERLQARLSDQVISPSRALADIVTRDLRLNPPSVKVVPTGIEIPTAGAASPPRGLAGKLYLLYFGRLVRRMGLKALIDTLPAVLERDRDITAAFAGPDL